MYKPNTSLKRKETQEFTHPYRNVTWFFYSLLVLRLLSYFQHNIFISLQRVTIQHINEHKYKQMTKGTMKMTMTMKMTTTRTTTMIMTMKMTMTMTMKI